MQIEQPGRRWRYPLLALGMLALLGGLWAGLLRLGWSLEPLQPTLAMLHGPLMVCGFIGTLISLERAVALGRPWAYTAPVCTGLGGVLLVAGVGTWHGPLLVAGGSAMLIAIFAAVLRIQPQAFAVVMALGAVAWLVGNVAWLGGAPVFHVVPWWLGFLVLTIAGERLELSRMLFHAPRVQRLFLLFTGLLLAALVVTALVPDVGMRLVGAALVALAAWLARYDVARFTVRQSGLTRFIAVCLLTGYAWLGVGGVLAAALGGVAAGPGYDAVLHAVFVGFVFSMIFGHAPIIFPSVLGVPITYQPLAYGPLALLHASLVLRLAGDLLLVGGVAGAHPLRAWGGMLNAVAVVLFLALTVYGIVRGQAAPVPVVFSEGESGRA
ncbi:MAG: hypothetical protein ABJF88_08325 [Rhodothermales bacterium]